MNKKSTINNDNFLPIPTQNENGVALLIVLMMVVSITIVAGSMVASQKLSTRKTALLFDKNQMDHKVTAGILTAESIITSDMQLNTFDSYNDNWAQELQSTTTTDGYDIQLYIYDASSRFNINNLYHGGKVDKQAFTVFQNLLKELNLNTNIAKAVLDWQDPNAKVYLDNGNESVVYANNKNTKALNQPFISIEQLINIPDITEKELNILRPYITAVPYFLPINANTVKKKLINAVFAENNESKQKLIQLRGSLSSFQKFKELNLFSHLKKNNERIQAVQLFDVRSQAFDVMIKVQDPTEEKIQYATVKIAKYSDTHSNGNNKQKKNANVQQKLTNKLESRNPLVNYHKRVWAFRPNLAYTKNKLD